jgi:membrane protease YdiL (CAAX protease family)
MAPDARTTPSTDRAPTTLRTPSGLFVVTFLAAWFVLDRLVTSPPAVGSSLLALAVSAAVLLLSERRATGLPWRALPARIGLARPARGAFAAASLVGAAVVATFAGGVAVFDIDVELRPNWPSVLVGVLLFHGLAEELVWRGYVYGRFRREASPTQAVVRSMPLLALTHVPIILDSGVAVGSLAVLTAAAVCFPLARLYDRGGRTVWGPAIVHGLIGTWQLVERDHPTGFALLVLCGSIVVPYLAFLTSTTDPDHDHQPEGTP